MALEKVSKGGGNSKVARYYPEFHFPDLPTVGSGFGWVLQRIWPTEPPALRDGFLYSVRVAFHRLHLGGCDLGGRREYGSGDP